MAQEVVPKKAQLRPVHFLCYLRRSNFWISHHTRRHTVAVDALSLLAEYDEHPSPGSRWKTKLKHFFLHVMNFAAIGGCRSVSLLQRQLARIKESKLNIKV